MSDKIKIKTVTGGNSNDQDDLKNCYFLPLATAGQYNFYDKNNNLVSTTPATITSGTAFTFSFDDPMETWTITATFSGTGEDATASGTWLNNADDITNDDGSFQAEAKGTKPEEEEASSASA